MGIERILSSSEKDLVVKSVDYIEECIAKFQHSNIGNFVLGLSGANGRVRRARQFEIWGTLAARGNIDWKRVHIFLLDERFGFESEEDSNAFLVRDSLSSPTPQAARSGNEGKGEEGEREKEQEQKEGEGERKGMRGGLSLRPPQFHKGLQPAASEPRRWHGEGMPERAEGTPRNRMMVFDVPRGHGLGQLLGHEKRIAPDATPACARAALAVLKNSFLVWENFCADASPSPATKSMMSLRGCRDGKVMCGGTTVGPGIQEEGICGPGAAWCASGRWVVAQQVSLLESPGDRNLHFRGEAEDLCPA
ncbi:unnamed protein product [Polarella glacialis]|uniref:Glucosamine/galactosamine-6-phosphate isomerase domain-containing protein n=1 Tax=Polarella glacialis TaxID=89957 RepID=A0A813I4T3_POLGL|nr:unnamed protein product [Polarella glacialis]